MGGHFSPPSGFVSPVLIDTKLSALQIVLLPLTILD